MSIQINWDAFNSFLNFLISAPPKDVYIYLFTHGGWALILWLFFPKFLDFYYYIRFGSYLSTFQWTFLAVDIPKGNEQTPKAVEQIFAQLAGAHKDPDLEELFIDGYAQPWFSFEIISIEGYTQFVIGTVKKYRDLVEAAVYAQYPEAEITEIEDYTKDFPSYFPNKEGYSLFGAEYILTNKEKQCYPIRTYKEFEHTGAEDIFKDPLAAVLETLSRLGKGEFVGLQILIKPINAEWNNWKKKGEEEVQRMIGAKAKPKDTIISQIGGLPGKVLDTAIEAVTGAVVGPGTEENKKEEPYSLMLHLPPGYKSSVEKVEQKISKICFATKIRYIYLAKKESYSKNRIAYGLTGAMKQYNTEDLNGLKPEFGTIGTHVHYFFKESRLNWRRTRLVNGYKYRSRWRGALEYLLNIEELATLWHFPMLTVKAPLVATTGARRGQPPATLPTEREGTVIQPVEKKAQAAPPPNLPV